jgi:hypothetical protein
VTSCDCAPVLPNCVVSERRQRLLGSSEWNGIDYAEVEDDQLSICVHLFGHIPEGIGIDNVRICGGRRIRDIRVTRVEIHRSEDPELDDCLRVHVDRSGDFSPYCLCIGVPAARPVDDCGYPLPGTEGVPDWVPLPGFDPRYACADFSFKAGCASPLDCKPQTECVTPPLPSPAIDYLAKDYASFRRLLLDRLAVTMPDWREQHVPDIGIALVELFAYTADRLSYYQDAVATEAYLATARRRISVRRHTRLIDYRLHEGCNARAWLTLSAGSNGTLDLGSIAFATRPAALPASDLIVPTDLDRVPPDAAFVFEPLLPPRSVSLEVIAAQSEMQFYTWGDIECCLPRGATRATLLDVGQRAPPALTELKTPAPTEPTYPGPAQSTGNPPSDGHVGELRLCVGDILIFEEVLGPTTGNPADADPAHRHPVRLTALRAERDALLDKSVIEVEWGIEDALPFSLCLSSRTPDCRRIDNVSVARGNVLLVDHGRTYSDGGWLVSWSDLPGPCGREGSVQEMLRVPDRFAKTLPRSPLAFAQPLPHGGSARALLMQDPRASLPQIGLTATPDRPVPDAAPETWRARLDLLDSGADDPDYVVEVEADATAHLRFGDGENGRRPEAGTRFDAAYRIGNGAIGNVGADSILSIVANGAPLPGLRVRNPMPAQAGTNPEPVSEAKLFAPGAIHRRLTRAVIAEDYASLARTNSALQGAAAALVWTGSWYEVDVAIDPLGTEDASEALCDTIDGMLEHYRRVGHDLAVVPARYVPLAVELTVCIEDGYLASHVLAALRDRLGARMLADGSKGFFHPDNLGFGDGIAISRLIATAQAIDGVRHVEVTRLERAPPRRKQPDRTAIMAGVLALTRDEIAQVDDDPNYPEHGTLSFVVRGGR